MKTMKFIPLAIMMIVAISSCTVEEYYTDDSYKESWFVEDYTITRNMWSLIGPPDTEGSYYECIIGQLPLQQSYYDGIITVYMYFDHHTQNEVQAPLPFTEYLIDPYDNAKYSVQYSYDIKADGTIAFKAYVSDYLTSLFDPGTQYFRVTIIV